ncbi:glycosyltransferase [Flavobacterium sp.]|uniref:glycosyltransferase n=1 Tax=Flavobacterium sp. TaxID=239 RepID=UPI00286D64D5|nr:glycosyltransferase [Flavobacterium sp.]
MKVLHITTSSKGGAGIAALRLHTALCESGTLSAYLSTNLTINFENKIIDDTFFEYKKPSIVQKIKTKFQNFFFPTEFQKATKKLHSIKQDLHCEIATLPYSIYKLEEHALVQDADIINLHWVAGIIDYNTFFKNCQKPIVWTFHDMNPFQGLFHYKSDELLNAKLVKGFDVQMKQLKVTAIKKIKMGAIITPSKWLLEEAMKIEFFSHFMKKHILNSIDLTAFYPKDRTNLREKHNIPKNDLVLIFVAEDITNIRKGFYLLQEALTSLKNIPITVLTIGKGIIPITKDIKTISLGKINTASEMASCYALSDAFVLPSLEDNLPNIMLEAFACGKPLIGFPIGGIAEHVKLGVTGILATEISSLSLAEAIKIFYETKDNYKPEMIRKYAEDNFNNKQQASAYIEVYNSLLK